jgi:hypothetical protein
MAMRTRGCWFVMIVLVGFCAGCELLADFDRDKIPQPPMDGAIFGDASLSVDAGGNPGRLDGGADDAGPDEDAGR